MKVDVVLLHCISGTEGNAFVFAPSFTGSVSITLSHAQNFKWIFHPPAKTCTHDLAIVSCFHVFIAWIMNSSQVELCFRWTDLSSVQFFWFWYANQDIKKLVEKTNTNFCCISHIPVSWYTIVCCWFWLISVPSAESQKFPNPLATQLPWQAPKRLVQLILKAVRLQIQHSLATEGRASGWLGSGGRYWHAHCVHTQQQNLRGHVCWYSHSSELQVWLCCWIQGW